MKLCSHSATYLFLSHLLFIFSLYPPHHLLTSTWPPPNILLLTFSSPPHLLLISSSFPPHLLLIFSHFPPHFLLISYKRPPLLIPMSSLSPSQCTSSSPSPHVSVAYMVVLESSYSNKSLSGLNNAREYLNFLWLVVKLLRYVQFQWNLP